MALKVPERLVAIGEFALQACVAMRSLGQFAQILQRSLHHQLAGCSRARKILNGVMKFKQERSRQFAYIVELLLGTGALSPGYARLPGGGQNPADERNDDERGRGYAGLVPCNEFSRSIVPGIAGRRNRQTLQVPP